MNDIEAERRRLAARLEQDVISALTLLQGQTAAYSAALRGNPDAAMALTILSSLVSQALQKARYLQQNLHPTTLETLGLEPALEAYAADILRMQGVTLFLEMPRLRDRLSAETEILFFRSVQTLVDFAVANTGATQVTITLHKEAQTITLGYTDNGQWYDLHLPIVKQVQQTLHANDMALKYRLDNRTLQVTIQQTIRESVTLTPRELEIVTLAAQGLTNKQIAGHLHVSARTVNFHLDNVYSKLQVNSRTEAALYAVQQGWIENPLSD